jgi:integrin beta 8
VRSGERGFALLVVMLLAAAIAFGLYTQVPRFAFESMRQREQLLMDRGNQYKRAIAVFYAVNKHFPARIEDLENTNDRRFLRRRYKDPMTGSDEWRIIHTNGTTLTDSLVQKPPTQNAANGTPGAGILPGGGPLGTNNMNSTPGQAGGTDPSAAANGTPQAPAVNPTALRRPSDRLNPGDGSGTTTASATNPQQDPNFIPGLYPANYNPNDPSTWPAITLAPANPQTGAPGSPGQPGQPGQAIQPGQNTQLGQFGQQNPLGQTGQTGQPGQPFIPGFGGQSTVPGTQQPVTQISAQPFGQGAQGVQPTPLPFGQQGQGVQPTPLPFGPQPNPGGDGSSNSGQPNTAPAQLPSGIPGQGSGQGGVNAQPAQIFNPGFGFQGNPLAPDPSQQPVGSPTPAPTANPPGFGNPAGQGGPPAQLGPALQTINNQLANPSGPPALPGPANAQNPQAAPGIAGVASKFEGVSIKIYNKRSKYKEWEFVFDPSTATTTGQPANGQNPTGQPGQPGQQTSQGTPGQGTSGQGTSGGFSLGANPFAPTTGQNGTQPGQTSNPTAPAASPFGQAQSPFAPSTQ